MSCAFVNLMAVGGNVEIVEIDVPIVKVASPGCLRLLAPAAPWTREVGTAQAA